MGWSNRERGLQVAVYRNGEEVAAPLGVADELYFGMPESELHRLARLEDAEGWAEFLAALPDDSPFFEWGPRATFPTAEFGNRADTGVAFALTRNRFTADSNAAEKSPGSSRGRSPRASRPYGPGLETAWSGSWIEERSL